MVVEWEVQQLVGPVHNNQPPIHQTAYHRACMHVIVPETEVAGKKRPHPAVRGVTTYTEVWVKIGNFTKKSHTKITLTQSMEITLMTAKQVVLNQSNSMISRVIMVLQCMYLGRKGDAKILLKIFYLKNNIGTALHWHIQSNYGNAWNTWTKHTNLECSWTQNGDISKQPLILHMLSLCYWKKPTPCIKWWGNTPAACGLEELYGTFKIYVVSYSRQTDRQTDRQRC